MTTPREVQRLVDPEHWATMATARRADRVRTATAELDLDALVVTSLTNVRWLTGFTGSNAILVVEADGLTLATDGRYVDQAEAELGMAGVDAKLRIERDLVQAIGDHVAGTARVGVEAHHVTWSQQRALAAAIGTDLVPTDELIENLRAIKDQGELDRIRSAARVVDATLADVAPMLGEGPSEREVALMLDHGIRVRGATASAYETIVASGPNSALPHARPTSRQIVGGDLVVIDVGALVDGYRSDMTRTFVVGEPNAVQRRQLAVVQEAQAAGVAAVGPGVSASAVDRACREVIAAAGWEAEFSHGTGHGVGLDIHELPRLHARSGTELEADMVITVEPGVYLAGEGGVRWEDLLRVTADGAEVLTGAPKLAQLG